MQMNMDLQGRTGAELKREGIQRVMDNSRDWIERALALLQEFARTRAEFMGEDFRLHAATLLEAPHSPNVWGGLINTAVRRGWIEKSGRWAQPRDPRSHACEKPVYRSRLVEA